MTACTQVAWGTIWTRPGLELKQRSLINIALLALQAKEAEVGPMLVLFRCSVFLLNEYSSLQATSGLFPHRTPRKLLTGFFRGAIMNGATELEIRETLLQAAVYCGIPTGMESFRIAEAALTKLKAEGKL